MFSFRLTRTRRRIRGVLMALGLACIGIGPLHADERPHAKLIVTIVVDQYSSDLFTEYRPAYQPNTIVYPDGRTIAFVGTHGGSRPNPLKGGVVELNGVMVIDVTNPERPVEKAHIPVPAAGGQSQSVRMCLGSDLPRGTPGRYVAGGLVASAWAKSRSSNAVISRGQGGALSPRAGPDSLAGAITQPEPDGVSS